MKVTIITTTYNSQKTLRSTLNSVASQNYKNIEHIIVDGGSTDQTVKILKEYNFKNKKIFKDIKGIYNAINFGIKRSSGDLISILNSDDIFYNNHIIDQVVRIAKKNKNKKIILGNLSYFKNFDYYKVLRHYSCKNFKTSDMKYGLMPPHPSSFVPKTIYQSVGYYGKNFRIAGDFDFFLRAFLIYKIKYIKVNKEFIKMRIGGISSKNIFSIITSTYEIIKSFKINNIDYRLFNIILRLPIKTKGLFFFDIKKINKYFKPYNIIYFHKNLFSRRIKIIENTKIISKKNFVLSGLNLAFIGFFFNNDVKLYENLYHWPDGIFAKTIKSKQPKIAGREILKKLNISNFGINKIHVLGNLSLLSKKYLEKKFKKKIVNTTLPYGNIKYIIKNLKIKTNSNELYLITLPTPKQEQIAEFLATNNKNYKIICIGASVAIASGEETEVPKFLKYFEFIWRLRSDTIRRSIRLSQTLIFALKGFISKKSHEMEVISYK